MGFHLRMFRRRKTVPLVFPNMAQTQHVHLRKMLKSKMKYQLQPPTRSIWPTQKGRLSYSCITGSHTSFYPEDGLMSSYLHLFCPLIFGLTNFWEKNMAFLALQLRVASSLWKMDHFQFEGPQLPCEGTVGFEKRLQIFSSFRKHTSFPAPFIHRSLKTSVLNTQISTFAAASPGKKTPQNHAVPLEDLRCPHPLPMILLIRFGPKKSHHS